MNLKLEKQEDHARKTEKETKEELDKLRKEIAEGMIEMEEKVTGKLKPKISEIQQQAKTDIHDAVQKEISHVDIPSLIQSEVQNAITKITETEGKPEDIKSAIKDKFKNLDIPALIKDEVNLAVRKIQKEAEEEEEEAKGEPGMGEPVKNK